MKYKLLLIAAVMSLACAELVCAQDVRATRLTRFVGSRTKAPRRPRLTTVTEERYRLQPGDVLEIQYRYSPEFNQTVTVQPDGYITLEIGGDLKVAGFTVEKTKQAILRQASTRLQDPVATLLLKEFQAP